MSKALGKTWMRRQKQPGNVFSGRQLQQPLWDVADRARVGRGRVPAGGRGGTHHLPAASLALAPSWALCVFPGILESNLVDRRLVLPRGTLAREGKEKWPC